MRESGNAVDAQEIFDLAPLLECALRRALKKNAELIVVENAFDSEDDFRGRFAFIIDNAERKIQSVPNTKAKTDFKGIFTALKKGQKPPKREPETVTYERKKTRVFTLETDGRTAYAFSYRTARVVALPKNIDLARLSDLIDRAEKVFSENAEAYPDGYSLHKRELKVQTFFQRHFPHKGDGQNEIIRKSVMLLAVCVFAVAAFMFIHNIIIAPMQNEALQSNIRTVFYQSETDPVTGKKKAKKVNWNKLKKINKEIKAWVKIDNTQIDYPVAEHKGDDEKSQYYFKRDINGNYSDYGTIYIDYRSKKGMDSKNIILHGHHMDNGSMFANLKKYGFLSGDLGFYKKSPVIKINTPKGGNQTYKIISVFKSNVNTLQGEYFDFYCGSFKSKAQFMNYVYNLRIRSLINCPVSVNEDDQLLTLVTCSYEFNDFRTVVVARKCRKGESSEVDVAQATLNKSSVWPQCYYSRYGGTRPAISTFKEVLKKNGIDWYDGRGKLKGSEQLPTSVTEETTEPTTEKPTEKPTQKPTEKTKFTIKVTSRGKVLKNSTVKKGSKVTLPEIKDFKKGNYKYTLSKWKVKGFGKKKYLRKSITKVIVNGDVKFKAVFKKTKIKVAKPTPKPTKATKATKATSATKATKPEIKPQTPTEATTEAPEGPESEE